MPLVVTNDVHYLRHGDHKPHDILLCIGTGKSVNDSEPPEVPRRSVLPEVRRADGAGVRRLPGGDEEHAADRRALQRDDPVRREPPAELRGARKASRSTTTSSTSSRQGYAQRLERLRQLDAEGKLRHTLAQYDERLAYEIAMIKKMGYPGTS